MIRTLIITESIIPSFQPKLDAALNDGWEIKAIGMQLGLIWAVLIKEEEEGDSE